MLQPLDVPTTGALDWLALLEAVRDGDAGSRSLLNAASVCRGRVRDCLKALRHGRAKDYLAAVQALEEYIPLVLSVREALRNGLLSQRLAIVTSWRSVLASDTITKKHARVECEGIDYEVVNVMVAFALCLYNQASTLTAEAQALQLNLASGMLCRAAGVLHHVSAQGYGQPFAERNVDLAPGVIQALELLSLASAQQVAVVRQSSAGGLPALLCRISLSSRDMCSSAHGLLSSVKRVSARLARYVAAFGTCCYVQALIYLGHSEAKAGRYGNACAYADWALSELSGLRAGDAPSYAQLTIGDAERCARDWTQTNRTVTFQTKPAWESLRGQLPSGRELCTPTPFDPATSQPPPPQQQPHLQQAYY